MDINKKKEEFSLAYVRAVAAVAGCGTSIPTPDDHSVDIQLIRRSVSEGPEIAFVDPQLGIQAKCTAQHILHKGVLKSSLPVKNYNDLRKEKLSVPRILVIHVIPEQLDDWILHSEAEMSLRHCSYWTCLKGLPVTDNADSVTVLVPQINIFTPQALLGIMERIEKGEPP